MKYKVQYRLDIPKEAIQRITFTAQLAAMVEANRLGHQINQNQINVGFSVPDQWDNSRDLWLELDLDDTQDTYQQAIKILSERNPQLTVSIRNIFPV